MFFLSRYSFQTFNSMTSKEGTLYERPSFRNRQSLLAWLVKYRVHILNYILICLFIRSRKSYVFLK